jgi:hypothetical protein
MGIKGAMNVAALSDKLITLRYFLGQNTTIV